MAKTTKKSSVKKRKSPLKPKIDKQVSHEKEVSKAVGPSKADVKGFGKMNSEEQRKILFNQFPGDSMGIVVGKPDKNDPYKAMIPEDNT